MGGRSVQTPTSLLRLGPIMMMMTTSSLLLFRAIEAAVDCATVTALVSTCSAYIASGTPEPYPGTPCCDAMTTLNMVAEPPEDRQAVCTCLMGLIDAYSPNATAIATLAGFCGVSLGFSISPNTDCNYL